VFDLGFQVEVQHTDGGLDAGESEIYAGSNPANPTGFDYVYFSTWRLKGRFSLEVL